MANEELLQTYRNEKVAVINQLDEIIWGFVNGVTERVWCAGEWNDDQVMADNLNPIDVSIAAGHHFNPKVLEYLKFCIKKAPIDFSTWMMGDRILDNPPM